MTTPYRVQEYKPKRRNERLAEAMIAMANEADKNSKPPRPGQWEAIQVKADKQVPKRWEAVVSYRHPSDGLDREDKRLTKAMSESAAMDWAKARFNELTRQANAPAPAPAKPPTLAEWWPRYMETCLAEGLAPSTIALKQSAFDAHLNQHLGALHLDKVSDAKRSALQVALQRIGISQTNIMQALSSALHKAVEHKIIAAMPCKFGKVARLKNPPASKEAPFYLRPQYEALLAAAPDTETEVIILLGGDAGLRAGEICGLERSAGVSFDRMEITVCKSIWYGVQPDKLLAWIEAGRPKETKPKPEYIEKGPKHDKIRRVAMSRRLANALRKLQLQTRGDRVFSQPDGQWFNRNIVSDMLRVAEQRAKLGRARESCVHVLRHTFCSHLALAGVPPHVIMKLAGHHALTITQRYMHLAPNSEANAIADLESSRAAETRVETKRAETVTT